MLIVGNKSDKGTPVRQDFSLQPEAFCARYKVKLKDISVIFYTLARNIMLFEKHASNNFAN